MNLNPLLRNLSICIVLMLVSVSSYATHLRAGEIVVERVSCNSLTFRITVTVFTNTINTNVLFGGEDDWLDFGDGTRILVPETQNTARPDLGEGVATASFTIEHTYAGFQQYTISYSEPNRNAGVLNMDGSVNTRFYIETKIIVDPFLGCNNTPQLLIPPIDRACTGVAFQHNPGAVDADGDSLSFELVIPFRDRGTQVFNYRDPINPAFYTNFETGNEEGTDRPKFEIDPVEGTLTWDAPGMAGEYNIAFIIQEWRKIDGKWYSNGFVRRDMQIIVDECDNERPDLEVPEDICVEAGTTLDAVIIGTDPDGDPVKIEAFSEIFNFAPAQSPATYTPNDGEFRATPAQLTFQWNTECAHVKEQPYQVVFKITDMSPTGSRLVTFKTWFITVVGPKPQWVNAQVDLATRHANLQWDPYLCQNAETLQVWRKVDSFQFVPDNCETGMPDHLGYSLIATLPVKDANSNPITTYTDTNDGRGLASGAEYCYRLVALFPLPRGGESYVSEEICIDPILADAPVITNVTVDRTATENGQVTVRWTRPFDLNETQFPGQLLYTLYRAEGFAGSGNIKPVHPGQIEDTVFVDTEPLLNTRDITYNYRVVLYAADFTNPDGSLAPIDTSTTASTVRLEAQSEIGKITLNWSAVVPWSNIIITEPNEHVLYRGPAGADESQLLEIAVIDPTAGGFTYADEGLSDTEEYCYRVMTRGAYGNPLIPEPLENFSQIVCAQPNDSIPPCTPALTVDITDCEEFLLSEGTCGLSAFTNTLRWARPPTECASDIRGYRVYRSGQIDGEYILRSGSTLVTDTFYVDNGDRGTGLNSMAYCYKISAVDRSGNESPLSDPVCNDNCPYYELPNVFTPGGNPDGNDCNNTFSAYSTNDRYIKSGDSSENPVLICGGVSDPSRCARFVEEVQLTVYNRWGKEVFTYSGSSSSDINGIYIDWDGRADDGSELSAGVYYYVAEVTFDSIDPVKREQTLKGWVHLIR